MLHPDLLAIVHHLAHAAGRILELGPFLGGSTIAMGWGLRADGSRGGIVSVELGEGVADPTFKTDNVFHDLRNNLTQAGVEGLVTVVPGNSRDSTVIGTVKSMAGADGYGLMFVDTDGQIARDFELYRDVLRPRAYLVVDDYFSSGASEKAGPTQEGLDALVASGAVECFGLYGWGSWVGRLTS